MIEKSLVKQIAEKYLADKEHFIVSIDVRPGNIIVVEIDNDSSINIEDCMALSKHIESQFDRELEDFELEVGSAGIGQAFKVLRQYQKNIGNEVEVLTKEGKKMSGLLKSVDESHLVLTIEKMEKPEGSKRKVVVEEDLTFTYEELKYTKYLIRFK
ncbi:ribosome maturation factor RimP [Bacteroidales bacterium]|nr:ribosome maturation factor RimP [Bacteroidales bacterium]